MHSRIKPGNRSVESDPRPDGRRTATAYLDRGGSNAGNGLLRIRGIVKSFSGVRALDQVDFDLDAGEVHVLFGENGAGKSTLINIVAGALRADRGRIELAGKTLKLNSVQEARDHGIAAVFQEFSLAPDLTVEENIFLGTEPTHGMVLDKRAISAGARGVIGRLGFEIDPKALLSTLSRAQQQMVEIAKALLTNPRMLILDEPTSSLTEREVSQLFRLIASLNSEGVAIIYITHRIGEIQQVGHRVTVLRDGKRIDTLPVAAVSPSKLVELMTGRPTSDFFPIIKHDPSEIRLALHDVTTRGGTVRNVSLEVRGGEIVGLAGLVGCGKSEIARACFGIEPVASGSIECLGRLVSQPSPANMLMQGLCYVPSDRRREGLLLQRPARENVSLASLDLPEYSRWNVLRRASEKLLTRMLGERMNVRPLKMENEVRQFSGGNQQKILLAKYIARDMEVFILDEPTLGIDVGAKIEVYEFLKDLVRKGIAVLLISSELPEILNLSNRMYVIRRGAVSAHLVGSEITERNVLAAFFEEATPDAF